VTTPTYAVCNGSELRVTANGWSARLKITAGALGIVDVYDDTGAWSRRLQWTPLTGFGFEFFPCVCSDLSTALAAAFHDYVSKRQERPRRRERPRQAAA
jgi:hypothetical protein